MPFGQGPQYLQLKSGTKLLRKNLSFFQLGTNGQPYYLEIGQRIYHDIQPVGQIFPSDRIGRMADARESRVFHVGHTSTPITYNGIPSPLYGTLNTDTYLKPADKESQTPGGPLFEESRVEYYIVKRQELDKYEELIHLTRKIEIKNQKKYEEEQKLLKDIASVIGVAQEVLKLVSMFAPQARIGVVTLAFIQGALTGADLATKFTQATYGNESAFSKLDDGILKLAYAGTKSLMPAWAQEVCKAGFKANNYYSVKDERPPVPYDEWVPADDILDQIYRFRCVIDPNFAAQTAATQKMFKDAAARAALGTLGKQ